MLIFLASNVYGEDWQPVRAMRVNSKIKITSFFIFFSVIIESKIIDGFWF